MCVITVFCFGRMQLRVIIGSGLSFAISFWLAHNDRHSMKSQIFWVPLWRLTSNEFTQKKEASFVKERNRVPKTCSQSFMRVRFFVLYVFVCVCSSTSMIPTSSLNEYCQFSLRTKLMCTWDDLTKEQPLSVVVHSALDESFRWFFSVFVCVCVDDKQTEIPKRAALSMSTCSVQTRTKKVLRVKLFPLFNYRCVCFAHRDAI